MMNRPYGTLGMAIAGICGVVLTLAIFGIVSAARSPDQNRFATGDAVGAAFAPDARQMLVGCEPGQVAVFRTNGAGIEGVQCVSTGVGVASNQSFAPVQTLAAPMAAPAPVVYTQAAPVYAQAPAPAPVRRESVSTNRRPWQKTALIIGGSTAAGAGVGGLMGGKKGALIGAAIGGGASTIYEATKR